MENEETKTSLEKLQPFVPRFYGGDESGGIESGKCKITLENLLFGRENACFVDIKLGTSTLTLDGRRKGRNEGREANDKKRTSFEHGFTMCGICLKDPVTGETRDKHYKLHPPMDEAKEWLAKLFTQGKDGAVDSKAVEYVKEQLTLILSYFTDDNEHTMRGMSLFVVIDSEKQAYLVKLIDLSSFEQIPQEDGPNRDDGLIKGTTSLLSMLEQL